MKPLRFTPSLIRRIRQALREDIGPGDITTRLVVPAHLRIRADLVVKEPAIVSGLVLLPKIFPNCRVTLCKKEGALVGKGDVTARIAGPAREILTCERVAINFVSRLSGIATLTREFVKRTRPYPCEILATRKTTPFLRDLEKYAVECGEGRTHRIGLYDQYMIKDNHKELMKAMGFSSSRYAASRVRNKRRKNTPLTVEVDHLRELPWAMSFRPDVILLDNFKPTEVKKAVRFVRGLKGVGARHALPLLEASGGITLARVREFAKTGVERISVGALTHSARYIDFSLEVVCHSRGSGNPVAF